MTIQEFKTLKVGDSIYLPNTWNKNTYTYSQVLDIDHLFKKVTVLLGRKPYSYRYLPLKGKVASCAVGICKYNG